MALVIAVLGLFSPPICFGFLPLPLVDPSHIDNILGLLSRLSAETLEVGPCF